MSALLGALKAALPYVDTIVSVATPLFTKKKIEAASGQMELLQQQIAELQGASAQNAESVKEIAAQLKNVVVALEQAADNMERQHRRLRLFCIVAVALAASSLAFVLYQR
jgi:chromosome segregation ATPase